MKKKILLNLIFTLLLCAFCSCVTNNPPPQDTTNITTETNIYSYPNATPDSDFRYEENNEGGISIVSYIGTNENVVIPAFIDTIPVTKIRTSAFYMNENITSVTIPDSVKLIGHDSFANCTALKDVVLSANLITIEAFAFENCSSLSNIELPESLTFIGYRAFANCTSLKHITIPKNSLNENSGECFVDSGLESVVLQEGIAVIPASAFLRTKIEEIVLPSTVKNIEYGGLATGCLKSVRLNEGLEIIEMTAFSSNPLTEIVIPKTVVSCSEYSFTDCENLKAIKFEGDAPKDFLCESDLLNEIFAQSPVNFTIFYHPEAQGFTSPTWNGYKTALW